MPFKFIHLTDTHLANPGLKLYGLDPRARLDAAIADINTHHTDAAFAVVTGDLTHWGEPESYGNFAEAMSALKMPYIAMVGNHDKRVACLDGLKAAPRDPNGFVQGTRTTGHGLFVFLDTLDETSHAGEMCARRFDWLAKTLAAAPADMPFVVFMHHPPFPVGVHAMDEIALKQSAEFAEVIAPYRARIRISSSATCTGRSSAATARSRSRRCAAPTTRSGSSSMPMRRIWRATRRRPMAWC